MKRDATRPSAWLYSIGLLLLTACGGGGSGPMVRGESSPPPPPPPPPPSTANEPCPAPITGDCVVQPPYTLTWPEFQMTGGRQSDFRLFVQGPGGWLNLVDGEYRFSGGTQIAGATLVVWDTLISDVEVLHDFTGMGFEGTSQLMLGGTVRGNVINDELISLRHFCGVGLVVCEEDRPRRIEGNYEQGETGTLEAVLGRDLQVTGSAMLDGGLILVPGNSRSYVLPTAPASILVLHAAEGVTGEFASWGADGLFLEGDLRYTAQDVFFDANRISLVSAMTTAGASSPIALGSAAHVDLAFGQADGYATAPLDSLTPVQRQFLESAASVQHIRDLEQATRTLESLAGHGHAMATGELQEHTRLIAAQLDAHLDSRAYDTQPGSWSKPLALASSWAGRHSLDGEAAGTDRWLDGHWLVGTTFAYGDTTLRFDRMGGHVVGRTSLAGAYAHYRDGRMHATVLAGSTRAFLDTTRPIDLDDAGEHQAFARRSISQVFVHGEAGYRIPIGAGQWTPYVAADYAALRSDGFVEQGNTGFEVAAQPTRIDQLSMAIGGRYAHEWNVGGRQLELSVDARYQRLLATHGDTLQAAFVGTPGALFDLEPWPSTRHGATLGVGLAGDLDTTWTWAMDYRGAFASAGQPTTWFLTLRRPL